MVINNLFVDLIRSFLSRSSKLSVRQDIKC